MLKFKAIIIQKKKLSYFLIKDKMANQLCVLESEFKLESHLKALKNININDLDEYYKFYKFVSNINEQQSLIDKSLTTVTKMERPLYCKLMSDCFVCFTGFKKENKNTVAHCIKLVHYMGGSVRKEYNKKITHLIVKSTLSTKYKVFIKN